MKRIHIEGLWKMFDMGFKKREGVLSRIFSLVSGRENKKEVRVLDNISFQAQAGENIGVIGKNGSGKSTLLRIIAGIYVPNGGMVTTHGKVIYVNGFGYSLKPKLTMGENILLMGLVMGLSQKDIEKKFKEIVSFSGLEDFVNTKVYQFSSGMLIRLNFSVGIHCVAHQNPDILLLDEIIETGGDIDFNKKALQKMEQLINGGATVVMASHNLDVIKKYCEWVLLFHRGCVIKSGKPEEVIRYYKENYQSLV